jgi:hypothetical protein
MNSHNLKTTNALGALHRIPQLAVIVAAIGLASLPPASADQVQHEIAQRHTLTGTWLATVVRPGQPNLLSLLTFVSDGNYLDESNSTAIRSLGHGSWKRIGDKKFSRTLLVFTFDASRNFTGHSERQHTLELSADGQTFTNLGGTLNRFDIAGNQVSTEAMPGGGETARRFSDGLPLVPGPAD